MVAVEPGSGPHEHIAAAKFRRFLQFQKFLPYALAFGALILCAFQLHHQGRLWSCACGRFYPWAGDIWSRHNSQHFMDPYSFTHMLHGLILFGLLWLISRRLPVGWRFCFAILIESLWEVFENSQFVINRYREATLAAGYQGDTVINSLGDILFCAIGFWLARLLGWRRSSALFLMTDLVLLICIRDSLVLNVLMLIYPIEMIKTWQMGR